jgi:hypothetical protein
MYGNVVVQIIVHPGTFEILAVWSLLAVPPPTGS